jgi:hypothetical protein
MAIRIGRNSLRIGLIVGFVASLAAFIGNAEKIWDFAAKIFPSLSQRAMAASLAWQTPRDYFGRRHLEEQFAGANPCLVNSARLDLDGDGVRSDLIVLYSEKTADPPLCPEEGTSKAAGEQNELYGDAVFYRWSGTGFVFAGNPRSWSDSTWTDASPVILRTIGGLDQPPLEVYALQGDQVGKIGELKAYTDGEDFFAEPYLTEKGVVVHTPNGLWRVAKTADAVWAISEIDVSEVLANDGHSQVLRWKDGELTYTGEGSLEVVPGAKNVGGTGNSEPSGPPRYIQVKPLDRLYLVGCIPSSGLKPNRSFPGALVPQFEEQPAVLCSTNEDDGFTVEVRRQ